MPSTQNQTELKSQVKEHWEQETCGTRYADEADRKAYFRDISAARYRLEPYIPPFARFKRGAGKKILEIGVGAGADFENWCQHADHATGVDLTQAAIDLTGERLALLGVDPAKYTLQRADAENLPFEDNTFDLVYSWGVLHHSPDTARAFAEVMRVLKPGGEVRAMVYHSPSWTGWLLYLQHAAARGQFRTKVKDVVFDHLESPGTKVYTDDEARKMMSNIGYRNIRIRSKLGPGDLLTIKLSDKYQSPIFKVIMKVYPRWLVRFVGDRFGLNLLIEATKAESAA